MYKLLPEDNKKEVSREYSLRRTSIALALLSFLLFFSTLALWPSLIHVRAKREASALSLESAKNFSATSDKSSLEAFVSETNLKLSTLAPAGTPDRPYELFKEILAVRSPEIKIIGFNWQKSDGKTEIRVNGVAKDRQSLALFQKRLTDSGIWQDVVLPVEALARDTDAEFEMTLIPNI